MKTFKGKAIYNPSGKAAEYSAWACNFYVGCSNGCEYCYCKKGILAGAMGGDKAVLKKCFRDEKHALTVFESELSFNIVELQKHGIFFSFTTDPCLPETIDLTIDALTLCAYYNVPVTILTKCTEWLEPFLQLIEDTILLYNKKSLFAFGFTLTGHDELEKGAATNKDRIRAINVLSSEGFKTLASIEPIIDLLSSYDMIMLAYASGCNLFKIGLMSGQKYNRRALVDFMESINYTLLDSNIYWKDSFLKQAGISRADLPENCVGRDYKLHKEKR